MRKIAIIGCGLAILALAACQQGSGVTVTTDLLNTLATYCDVSGSVPGAVAFHCTPGGTGTTTVSLPVSVGLVAVPK